MKNIVLRQKVCQFIWPDRETDMKNKQIFQNMSYIIYLNSYDKQLIMISAVLSVLLILIVALFNKFYFRPYRIYKKYVKAFTDQGYKVLQIPFKPFQAPLFLKFSEDAQKSDALHIVKKQYSSYDIVVSNVIDKVLIQFMHPDFVRSFFDQKNNFNYPKAKSVTNSVIRGLGEGLVFSEGHVWKRKRRILNSVFNFQLIKGLTQTVARICDEAMDEAEKRAKILIQNDLIEYEILEMAVEITSNLMIESFLGGKSVKNIRVEGIPVGKYFTDVMNQTMPQSMELLAILFGNTYLDMGVWPHHRQINRKIRIFNEWGAEYIRQRKSESVQYFKQKLQAIQKERQRDNDNDDQIKQKPKRENIKPKNIIEAMVLSQMNGTDSYSEKQILEQFNTFFFAGTDTTANYLQMMIYLLSQNPDVEKKVRGEISNFMKQDDYSYGNLKNFTYIDCVMKETTRIYGPDSLFIREAQADGYLNHAEIYKGTYVNVVPKANHHKKEYFADSEVFRPERWQNETEHLPSFGVVGGFSAGSRSCIGKHLALLNAKIGLIKFVKRYNKFTPIKNELRFHVRLVYSPDPIICRMQKVQASLKSASSQKTIDQLSQSN